MQFNTDPNTVVIYALVFLLGLLIGLFLTAGGRKKWKTRYYDEVDRHRELERNLKEREDDWATRDKARDAELAEREREWREQDSLRAAAIKSPVRGRKAGAVDPAVDRDVDGVPDDLDRRPDDDRKA
jgi:C4-dicarboxylate-specific signal transduction histidine kinase